MRGLSKEMELAVAGHPVWRESSSEEMDNTLEGLEKYIMTKLYDRYARPAEAMVRIIWITLSSACSTFLPTDKDHAYVLTGDFVSTVDGTGIVHIAPAFGQDDSEVGRKNNLPTFMTVNGEGRFIDAISTKLVCTKKSKTPRRPAWK